MLRNIVEGIMMILALFAVLFMLLSKLYPKVETIGATYATLRDGFYNLVPLVILMVVWDIERKINK